MASITPSSAMNLAASRSGFRKDFFGVSVFLQTPSETRSYKCQLSAVKCASTSVEESVPLPRNAKREVVRIALPSKGRMAEDTLELLKACELNLKKPNPRQYIASVKEMDGVEVWFQRASDVVRKLRSGDVDLGIVGYDMLREYGEDDEDLILVHDSLGFGSCHLAIAVPSYGIFENVTSLEELIAMPQWTETHPLRIVTGYTHLGRQFFKANNIKNVVLTTADGALEAAPAMGTADAILDLVSSGTTLRENNLKELKGARVLQSQGVLVASRKALLGRKGVLEATRELVERLEAHLRARDRFVLTANIRGRSEEEVASLIWESTAFPGLQGPTVSRVYTKSDSGRMELSYFSAVVVVPKTSLYESIKELRKIGGSGVLVSPLTYIFDEEPERWVQLLANLGLPKSDV